MTSESDRSNSGDPPRADEKPSDLEPPANSRVLVVDDEPQVLDAISRMLEHYGFLVDAAADGKEAVKRLLTQQFDVVISDIMMPNMDGVELLRIVREKDLDLPVMLITGLPNIESATSAVKLGAFEYIPKPFDTRELIEKAIRATRLYRLAKLKREALVAAGDFGGMPADLAGLESSFDRTMMKLWLAYQPIVDTQSRTVYAYEALMRSDAKALPHPGAILAAAERLHRVDELGRTIRKKVAELVDSTNTHALFFVNLHPYDLLDPDLYAADAPLSKCAKRVVLEVTERHSLDNISDLPARLHDLRQLGFRLAVDDLGAGYAGLSSLARLHPDFVKIDMSIVRDIDTDPVKQKLVRGMSQLCREMGLGVVVEGVETAGERDALHELDCWLLQGYYFARPQRTLQEPKW